MRAAFTTTLFLIVAFFLTVVAPVLVILVVCGTAVGLDYLVVRSLGLPIAPFTWAFGLVCCLAFLLGATRRT